MATDPLKPAKDLARAAPAQWPGESTAYRAARTALLAEEIELRRHIQRVAAQRRALPPGAEITQDYLFESEDGPVKLSGMFGDHDTLILYSMMYGPDRKQGCPMCSAQLDAWDGEARHIKKRVALGVVARSPISRILAYAKDRGWTGLTFYSDPSGDYTADYVGERDADAPAYTVFQKKNGTVRHFYSAEGGMEIADPGQDPHNAPDMNPLWILLDTTPEGRGENWYPKLDD
ncbi:Predicted dithiol-disulfide oxidoreductase, DUF899 family [Loktanella atrilutea]|uniref:Predicted dithiol-disulfide oxidoreductase, DUF899 family n=1 Tax=Loktanella atrilutea TaxID=366533 RepID=A0A1M5CMJ0_LOKAT|nr:DUF899 family protein [Loktanella atrilutea]SHF55921.1 Predicted dithiol-disulfide oxidoreductase, DUF899 family [Loktanella atrilutea]